MQFTLDAEQQLLSDSVARFVRNAYDFEARQNRLATGGAFHAATWATFADNGWLAAALPEAHGGLGGSIVDAAIIAQQLGRGLALEPYLGSAVLAAQTFYAAASQAQRAAWLPSLAEGSKRLALAYSEGCGMPQSIAARAAKRGDLYALNGRKSLVLGGLDADGYVVSAWAGRDIALFLVRCGAGGLNVTSALLHDGRSAAELNFEGVEAELLGVSGDGLAALRAGLAHGLLALCAELVGAMEQAIEITAPYLRTRRQFGVPLASFQALQHRMADMAAELELARSMLFAALASFENDHAARRDVVLGGAKAFISNAALNVCGQAIQLHGGIGMAEEYSIGHYYKRAVVSAALLGGNALHESACAAALRERLDEDAVAANANGLQRAQGGQ